MKEGTGPGKPLRYGVTRWPSPVCPFFMIMHGARFTEMKIVYYMDRAKYEVADCRNYQPGG